MTTGIARETGYIFDSLLELTASTTDTASDVTATVDLGAAGAGDNEDGVAVVAGHVVIDVSALLISDNNETYTFTLVGSDSSGVAGTAPTTGDQEDLVAIEIGANEILVGDVDSDVGRYIMPFTNHRNTRAYRYVFLSLVIGGTTASVTYSAFISKTKVG